ncbi:MAG: DUF3995 domain-containing protein [Saprospiraceae bacterium]|nr:DUF3995 domain-containing protein [Saprospiraceae bacterium]
MMILLSILLAAIFFGLSCIHIYWGLGGKWAFADAFPTNEDGTQLQQVPGMAASFIVAAGLFCFGLFYLIKAEIVSISLPTILNNYGLWIIAGIFLLRAIGDFNYVGIFKKNKTTPFCKRQQDLHRFVCLLA